MLLFDNDSVVGLIAPITEAELALQPILHESGMAWHVRDAADGAPFVASDGNTYLLRRRTNAEVASFQGDILRRQQRDEFVITAPTFDPAYLSTYFVEENIA